MRWLSAGLSSHSPPNTINSEVAVSSALQHSTVRIREHRSDLAHRLIFRNDLSGFECHQNSRKSKENIALVSFDPGHDLLDTIGYSTTQDLSRNCGQ
ncbi:hypothetical protein SAMN02910418_01778 [Bowdeniella nasicola]|uniref:Uncharacterized protein n=1 Tax=Bowdeniella nasicola TaxID=208480 RepID=A0A1H4BU28_9ACTO|nr:hypothetical protein SAMN02910418_01778 [Bowdeniella nasicola]